MSTFRLTTLSLLLFLSVNAFAKKPVALNSPDGKIKFVLSTDQSGLFYQVFYKGVLMVDKSRLNLVFKQGGAFNQDIVIAAAKPEKLVDDTTC